MPQIEFPFTCNDAKLKEFLTRLFEIEDAKDRLREDKRLLKDDYAGHMPMRAVLVAMKVVRAKVKLEHHVKDPFTRVYQTLLEHAVEDHLKEMERDLGVAGEPLLMTPQSKRNRAWEAGWSAGEQGDEADTCPMDGVMAEAWLCGHSAAYYNPAMALQDARQGANERRDTE